MYRNLFKFAVTTLTILTANLITAAISDKLVSLKWEISPLRFTLIAMGIITVVFYPLFTKLEDWLNALSKKFVTAGKSVGGRYLGLLGMFLLGLLILFYFYAQMWYHLNIFKLMLNGRFFQLF